MNEKAFFTEIISIVLNDVEQRSLDVTDLKDLKRFETVWKISKVLNTFLKLKFF